MGATPQNLNVAQSPGESSDFAAMLQHVLRRNTLDNHSLLPAQVIDYDRSQNVATVQAMVLLVDTSNRTHQRKAIANVPCLSLGAGGFMVNFPIAKGDLGWIAAADRDLSLFLQDLQMSPPPTGRAQTFEDSLFIPDVFRKYVIAAEDSAAMVIQSVDGSTKISIRDGDILIAAPNKLVVRVPSTEFDGDVTVTGMTTVNGGFDASSSSGNAPCTLPQSTTINNVRVATHGHEQQGTSGRTLGGMES